MTRQGLEDETLQRVVVGRILARPDIFKCEVPDLRCEAHDLQFGCSLFRVFPRRISP